jgi:hypothetical protein
MDEIVQHRSPDAKRPGQYITDRRDAISIQKIKDKVIWKVGTRSGFIQ